jgi:hypothetical protein
MTTHEILVLREQKFVGIKTNIQFKEVDQIDFSQLQKDVCKAKISNIDHQGNFMAMDTDFTEDSFSYTPLVPVSSFDHNEGYTHFTREQGAYCAFKVKARDLNPKWFKGIFEYVKKNQITLEDTGYDLEYYDENLSTMFSGKEDPSDRVLRILLKLQIRG